MPTRQSRWPTRWLMTDERLGDSLGRAIAALPAGGGVVFRHYATPGPERGLVLGVARDVALAKAVGAALVHNPVGEAAGLAVSRAIHSPEEAEAARAAGAALAFVSPLHATASHPQAVPLGLARAVELAREVACPAIALGGMNAERGAEAIAAGFHGWAAISYWTESAIRT